MIIQMPGQVVYQLTLKWWVTMPLYSESWLRASRNLNSQQKPSQSSKKLRLNRTLSYKERQKRMR